MAMELSTLAPYEQMLRALMSTDNAMRNQAEEGLNQAKQNPDQLFTALITMLRSNSEEQVRDAAPLAADGPSSA